MAHYNTELIKFSKRKLDTSWCAQARHLGKTKSLKCLRGPTDTEQQKAQLAGQPASGFQANTPSKILAVVLLAPEVLFFKACFVFEVFSKLRSAASADPAVQFNSSCWRAAE